MALRAAATALSHSSRSAAVYLLKLSIVVDVVVFVKQIGCENHAYGSRREIFESPPDAGHDEQSLPRMVEQHFAFLPAVVDDDMERAAHGDEKLVETAVGVAAARFAARNVIYPIDAADAERHVDVFLRDGEVAARVGDFRQCEDGAVCHTRLVHGGGGWYVGHDVWLAVMAMVPVKAIMTKITMMC